MEKDLANPDLLVGVCPHCEWNYYTKNTAAKVWRCFSCGRFGKLTNNLDEIASNLKNKNL